MVDASALRYVTVMPAEFANRLAYISSTCGTSRSWLKQAREIAFAKKRDGL